MTQIPEHSLTEKGGDDSKIVVTGRYGANITVPKAPTRTGYQFLGWDEDVEMTIPDKDLTYKAQWLKMEYTLQFKTGEGTSVSPIKGNYGDKISVPKDPTEPDTFSSTGVRMVRKWTSFRRLCRPKVIFTQQYGSRRHTRLLMT